MKDRTLRIIDIERFPNQHKSDRLTFSDGINLIIGEPNTGKTKWLAIIDFLLGDNDSPKATLGAIYELYDSAKMRFKIGETEYLVERRWKESGLKEKILLDGREIDSDKFSDFVLSELKIPTLRFPQGYDLSTRWRTISWRILMRHCYRHSGQWNDLVPKQVKSETHACIMTFMGLAEKLFPDERGELAEKQNKKNKLEARKEQFEDTLQDITKEIVSANDMGVAVTNQSIEMTIEKHRKKIESLVLEKEEIFSAVLEGSESELSQIDVQVSKNWADLKENRETLFEDAQQVRRRLEELQNYQMTILDEKERLDRAFAAGRILSALKVTHCPLCDQEVVEMSDDRGKCFLCKQNVQKHSHAGEFRLELEKQQLSEDLIETKSLITSLKIELQANLLALREVEDKLSVIENRIKPIRKATTAIQIPEIAFIDQEIGSISERIRQWERIHKALSKESELIVEIKELNKQIKELESDILLSQSELDFTNIEKFFDNSMNTYLNLIHQSSSKRWSKENRVVSKFKEKGFDFKINNLDWQAALGDTWGGYFLLAYHYALMDSSAKYFYPGFLILDYPKGFEDSETVSANANHTLAPFINLLSKDLANTQIIAAGKGFSPFQGANVIYFDHQWIATESEESEEYSTETEIF